MHSYYVYMLTNKHGNVLYTGVTNNVERRVSEHGLKTAKGFTARYNVEKLVYFEEYSDINDAIAREKQLKGWTRKKKDALVETMNPKWENLTQDWYGAREGDPSLRSG